jgi:hypothetical protein
MDLDKAACFSSVGRARWAVIAVAVVNIPYASFYAIKGFVEIEPAGAA